jgi:uncharacterized membrane protein
MAEHYIFIKWLHIVGATVLFGTGLGTAFHFWFAWRSGNAAAIAAAARSTVVADYVFTLPAVILQPLTGLALAYAAGYPLGSTWIAASVVLYVVAGACWIPVVFIQLRLRDLAAQSASAGAPLPLEFTRLARRWFVLGWPAFLAMLAIFALMIARPA